MTWGNVEVDIEVNVRVRVWVSCASVDVVTEVIVPPGAGQDAA